MTEEQKSNNGTVIAIMIVIVVLAGFGLYSYMQNHIKAAQPASSTEQSVSDGTITMTYLPSDYGLAVNQQQLLVHPYIPPCDEGFDYCLYYVGPNYKGTNFESAGLRVEKRADLKTESLCLDTPPNGYSAIVKPDGATSTDVYSATVFRNVGNAAAGHYVVGSLYRLYYRPDSSCHEFEARVGQSQYQNYPAGSIKEFTASDQASALSGVQGLLEGISLPDGTHALFASLLNPK